METKQPNATPEIKLTQKALQNFAREKLLALAKNSPELFMCLVAHARKTDKELQVYRDDSRAKFELYKFGMLMEEYPLNFVHPAYIDALEKLIQEFFEKAA